MNRVIAAFNDFDLVVLIESQPLDLDLDVQDQSFQTSVDTSINRTSTSVKVVLVSNELSISFTEGLTNFG